jgi:hypothetical protein
MNDCSAAVVPFALKDRWTVTVESEREFVNVRHRTRWYAVARRIGQEDRHYRCASRADAVWIAEQLREGFAYESWAEHVEAMLNRLPPIQRARAIEKIRALGATEEQTTRACHLRLVVSEDLIG